LKGGLRAMLGLILRMVRDEVVGLSKAMVLEERAAARAWDACLPQLVNVVEQRPRRIYPKRDLSNSSHHPGESLRCRVQEAAER
jgi:hypothetical protein